MQGRSTVTVAWIGPLPAWVMPAVRQVIPKVNDSRVLTVKRIVGLPFLHQVLVEVYCTGPWSAERVQVAGLYRIQREGFKVHVEKLTVETSTENDLPPFPGLRLGNPEPARESPKLLRRYRTRVR